MRHHHEEGRGPRGRHGDPSEHGDHGRRGGGRRQRFFGHGELRLIILDILSRNASHGYELIKEIETLTQGNYSPSPGVIYPTLDLLQDQGLISVEDDNGRKKNRYQRGRKTAARREPGAPGPYPGASAGADGRLRAAPGSADEARAGKLQSGPRPESEPAGQQCRPAQADHRHYRPGGDGDLSARLSLFCYHRLPRPGAARTTTDRPVHRRQAENLVSSGIKRANSGAMRLNFTHFVFYFAFIPIFTASAELA